MKVLHICKVYLPVKGGVQTVVDWIYEGLIAYGVQSSIYTTYSKGDKVAEELEQNISRYRSWLNILNMPISPSLVFALFRDAKSYDVVCIHYPFPLADLALAFAKLRRAKLLIYWHSEIVSQAKASLFTRVFTHIVLKRASMVVCSSPNLIDHSTILQQYRDKCVVIPFGMPQPLNTTVPCRPSESTNLVFIGRHVAYKGIDVLINAFKLVCNDKRFDAYSLSLVGGGPLLNDHRQQIEKAGLSHRVKILQNVSNEKLQLILAKARCLVLPSRLPSEAFALVQLEAMALGKPIINTALNSGVPWVARDGKEAITVQAEDVNGLTLAIIKLCQDSDYVDRLGDNAKQRYNNVFSHAEFCATTYDLYKKVSSES